LLNRYTVISRIVGSNPIPSAISISYDRFLRVAWEQRTPGKPVLANRLQAQV